MACVVAIQQVGQLAPANQLALQFRGNRGFAGGTQTRDPYDAAGVAAQMRALFRRDLALGPENVFAQWFAHARRMSPLNLLFPKPSSRKNRWRFKSVLFPWTRGE